MCYLVVSDWGSFGWVTVVARDEPGANNGTDCSDAECSHGVYEIPLEERQKYTAGR